MSLIEMKVGLVGTDEQGTPLVLLYDRSMTKALPLWMGAAGAQAIAQAIQKQNIVRPKTHQLFLTLAAKFNYEIKHVLVDTISDGIFLAKVVLGPASDDEQNSGAVGATLDIDARPSDAIALATFAGVPVLVSDTIMESAGLQINANHKIENDDFKRFLNGVKASDFKLDTPVELPPDEE